MENILFFDTETTGLPKNYRAPSSDTDNWPRLVQLSWILTDSNGKWLNNENHLIIPQGFTIPVESSRVHGITTEIALSEGSPLDSVISLFLEDFDKASLIVGHNISFDKKIVGAELIRMGMEDILLTKPSACTMVASTDYCQIPGKFGYKYPSLKELHQKLFECDFENAHDASADVLATEKCFWEMRSRGLI